MIKGIGMDIIEIDRVAQIINRKPKFVVRILTGHEKEKWDRLEGSRRNEFLAGRFAAKEAFSKALGTGIGKHISFLDIEIRNDENGKPYINKPFSRGVHLSITHSREYAAAQVIIEEE
ncbi:holo-ACP synthase [Peribacillus sp. SCS-155]|uniref:holo-ACP synthase n=1 Tax=Peribacillus sedimenti TaxID=3115297 RepID=UPI003905843E